jgi:ferredoxin
MEPRSLQLVYFSPTGTTKKIVEEIARVMDRVPARHVDITGPQGRTRRLEASKDDLLIVGVPVYFGRVQTHAAQWLNTIQGRDTPAVCVVVYGNREYDDTLLELKETLANRGCIPIACAAYVAEHSFSGPQTPIAPGRPDSADLSNARSFGEKIAAKLAAAPSIGRFNDVSVPGRHPYIDMKDSRAKLSGVDLVSVDGQCVQCGRCARLCPVGAIDLDHFTAVDRTQCILCHACIKRCPTKARRAKSELIRDIAVRLSDALQGRKEPAVFL